MDNREELLSEEVRKYEHLYNPSMSEYKDTEMARLVEVARRCDAGLVGCPGLGASRRSGSPRPENTCLGACLVVPVEGRLSDRGLRNPEISDGLGLCDLKTSAAGLARLPALRAVSPIGGLSDPETRDVGALLKPAFRAGSPIGVPVTLSIARSGLPGCPR
ncbi:unnamed protein product [Pleuronectes platessa]|uniref:Uncharacterized protein n=1 Tax=Pleuronectes platessa TaxID=8262 RepID=A0A9N7VHL7_PLEPL|nr:unnamed protein product [Pleuronectes platessa]